MTAEPRGAVIRARTPRGFAVYDEFDDMDGGTIRIQESSNAEGVWIFYDRFHDGAFGMLCGTPHLSDEQVRRTRDALQAYLDDRKNDPAPQPSERG